MVTPILTFLADMWGTEYSDTIEDVNLHYCREYLVVNSTINYCMILSECGTLPLCTIYIKLK